MWQIEELSAQDPIMSRTRKFDGLSLFSEVLGAKYGCFRTQQTSGVLGWKRGLFYGRKRTQCFGRGNFGRPGGADFTLVDEMTARLGLMPSDDTS
jgi:hypothetical protein